MVTNSEFERNRTSGSQNREAVEWELGVSRASVHTTMSYSFAGKLWEQGNRKWKYRLVKKR